MRFAKLWDSDLQLQGFVKAFDPNKHLRAETQVSRQRSGDRAARSLHNLTTQPLPRTAIMQPISVRPKSDVSRSLPELGGSQDTLPIPRVAKVINGLGCVGFPPTSVTNGF